MDIFENLKNKKIPVILKWPNGRCKKSKDIIRSSFPKNLTKCERYVEPFVGGGSVLITFLLYHMEASGFPQTSKIYASDINHHLINFHNCVKNSPNELYDGIVKLFDTFFEKEGHEGKKTFYKQKCDEFNSFKKDEGENEIQNAVLLFFLNHTCFKGLYRVSRKGLFNSPYGFSPSDSIDTEKMKKVLNIKSFRKKILNLGELFQRVEFLCQDNCQNDAERNILKDYVQTEKDLVFIDLPSLSREGSLFNQKSFYIFYQNDGSIKYLNKDIPESPFNLTDLYLKNFSECSISSSIYNALMETTISSLTIRKKKNLSPNGNGRVKNSDLVNEIISDDILKRRKKWAEIKNKQRKREIEKYGEIKKYSSTSSKKKENENIEPIQINEKVEDDIQPSIPDETKEDDEYENFLPPPL